MYIQILAVEVKSWVRNQAQMQKSGIHSKARIVIKYLADCQEPENLLQLRTREGWRLITHTVKEGIKD